MPEEKNVQELSREIDIRRDKIKRLKEQGVLPYVDKFTRTHTIEEAREVEVGKTVTVCGRMTARRIFGKFGFCSIEDINAKTYGLFFILLTSFSIGKESDWH